MLIQPSHLKQNWEFPGEGCSSFKISLALLVDKIGSWPQSGVNFAFKHSVLSVPPTSPEPLPVFLTKKPSDQHLVHHTDFAYREGVFLGIYIPRDQPHTWQFESAVG